MEDLSHAAASAIRLCQRGCSHKNTHSEARNERFKLRMRTVLRSLKAVRCLLGAWLCLRTLCFTTSDL
eukprot:3095-Heterococcus_DN1.PRE.2